jgi:hypothetical protein
MCYIYHMLISLMSPDPTRGNNLLNVNAATVRFGVWPFARKSSKGSDHVDTYETIETILKDQEKLQAQKIQQRIKVYRQQVMEALEDWERHMRPKNGDPLVPVFD